MANDLYTKIQEHLAKGGRVQIVTYTRATEYRPKHAGFFHPAKEGEIGVWVDQGKRRVYALPSTIRFSVLPEDK